jgi:toxin FitB
MRWGMAMATLLDTCILRELHSPRPYWKVRRAVDDLWWDDLHLSVITFGIMEAGVTLLPQEFKQRRLRAWMNETRRKLAGNLHGIDHDTSVIWGKIVASAGRRRLKLPHHDSLIAATAKRHGFVVMTRNIGFFAPFQIEVFNPWGDLVETTYDFGDEPEIYSVAPGSNSSELAPSGSEGQSAEADEPEFTSDFTSASEGEFESAA